MTAIGTSLRYFNKCRVFYTPTNLTAPPYGGTELGAVRELDVSAGLTGRPIFDYAAGFASDSIDVPTRDGAMVSLIFRQWDDNIINKLWPSTSGSAAIGIRPGTLASTREVKLLLAPEDTSGIFCVIYKALPAISETNALRFGLQDELSTGVVFRMAWNSTKSAAYKIGLSGDINL